MMIDGPRWELQLSAAEEWNAVGEGGERGLELAGRVLDRLEVAAKPRALRVRIHDSIPAHRGFGGGTQLGLAVAAAVRELVGLPAASALELAELSGRGVRSAVGAHGFVHGGLIWETGRLTGEALGRLARRVVVPETWRIVLLDTGAASGLSGEEELAAFRRLPSPATATVTELVQLAEQVIIPAAENADFAAFGDGVYRYGRLAGECFAPIQGGPYASIQIARCVDVIREQGCAGAGQSSWGPTVFAFAEGQRSAETLRETLSEHPATRSFETTITRPDNRGAKVRSV
jgi:beta-RFAP synthase